MNEKLKFFFKISERLLSKNLFSLVRKTSKNKSPLSPDKNHLHQLFFYFIFKKIKTSKVKTTIHNLKSMEEYSITTKIFATIKIKG